MAISLENLIDLPLLTYYDEKIKKYVVAKVNKASNSVSFLTKEELPAIGEKDRLYITDKAILQWDGSKYVELGSSGSASNLTYWGSF